MSGEMLPGKIQLRGVDFDLLAAKLWLRTVKRSLCLRASQQVYILAAATGSVATCRFTAERTAPCITAESEDYVRLKPGYIKPAELACTHLTYTPLLDLISLTSTLT